VVISAEKNLSKPTLVKIMSSGANFPVVALTVNYYLLEIQEKAKVTGACRQISWTV